ncbi:hypothetical protein Nepgr_027982 [Nepenthes gracilis]|uniref:RRM domain-containing protein n=1 Tax=Nepenthes gracilis TaxID=150966 RepID=A0AAD3TBC4_NEPGR|nr:hypothetical protein Nepgr_027982 [Nepenthes gracilis]
MSRKRDRPYTSTHIPYSFQKRRRPLPNPTTTATSDPNPPGKPSPPPAVAIIGLPTDCSVLDLKSRFEIYGSISRIRIDHEGVGFITFRTKSAAESAVSAALDPSFGITLDSKRVQVLWTSGSKNREASEREQSLSSKLLRAERPLSTHRRDNWLIPATVTSNSGSGGGGGGGTGTPLWDHQSFKGRQIVAYDDIL